MILLDKIQSLLFHIITKLCRIQSLLFHIITKLDKIQSLHYSIITTLYNIITIGCSIITILYGIKRAPMQEKGKYSLEYLRHEYQASLKSEKLK